MKHKLLAVLTLLLSYAPAAQADDDTCSFQIPEQMTIDNTTSGDDLYGSFTCDQYLINKFWKDFGFDDSWKEKGLIYQGSRHDFGFSEPCNVDLPLARTFNSLQLLRSVRAGENGFPDGPHYIFAANKIENFQTDCSHPFNGAIAGSLPIPLLSFTALYLPFFSDYSVPERAAIIAHEARHYDKSIINLSLTGHESCPWNPDYYGCDPSWEYQGPFAYQVSLLWDYATRDTIGSPALRYLSGRDANVILDVFFVKDPGFRLPPAYYCPKNRYAVSSTECAACPEGRIPNPARDACGQCPGNTVASKDGSTCEECLGNSIPSFDHDRCVDSGNFFSQPVQPVMTGGISSGFVYLPHDSDPTDSDGDGVLNGDDNCPAHSNTGQSDLDQDGTGDACDADDDGDNSPDNQDNCPSDVNADQTDGDADGLGDQCDACPEDPDNDPDHDGVCNNPVHGEGNPPPAEESIDPEVGPKDSNPQMNSSDNPGPVHGEVNPPPAEGGLDPEIVPPAPASQSDSKDDAVESDQGSSQNIPGAPGTPEGGCQLGHAISGRQANLAILFLFIAPLVLMKTIRNGVVEL